MMLPHTWTLLPKYGARTRPPNSSIDMITKPLIKATSKIIKRLFDDCVSDEDDGLTTAACSVSDMRFLNSSGTGSPSWRAQARQEYHSPGSAVMANETAEFANFHT